MVRDGRVAARQSCWADKKCCQIDCIDGCCDSCLVSTCCIIVDSFSMEKCCQSTTSVLGDLIFYIIMFGIPACITVAIYLALVEKTFAGVAVVAGALFLIIAGRKYHKVKLERRAVAANEQILMTNHADHHYHHHGGAHGHPVPLMVAHAVPGPENSAADDTLPPHHHSHIEERDHVPTSKELQSHTLTNNHSVLSQVSDDSAADTIRMWRHEAATGHEGDSDEKERHREEEDHRRTLLALQAHAHTHPLSAPNKNAVALDLSMTDSDVSVVTPPLKPQRLRRPVLPHPPHHHSHTDTANLHTNNHSVLSPDSTMSDSDVSVVAAPPMPRHGPLNHVVLPLAHMCPPRSSHAEDGGGRMSPDRVAVEEAETMIARMVSSRRPSPPQQDPVVLLLDHPHPHPAPVHALTGHSRIPRRRSVDPETVFKDL